MPELLLTVEQAAERLQLHPESVRRQLKRGQLRGIKRGTRWRVPESAIEESTPAGAQRGYSGGNSANSPVVPSVFAIDSDEMPDLKALFAPPTPEEIAARLKVWEEFGNDSIVHSERSELDLSGDRGDVYGYTERENAQR